MTAKVVQIDQSSAQSVMAALGMDVDHDIQDIVVIAVKRDGSLEMSANSMPVERMFYLGHIVQLNAHSHE